MANFLSVLLFLYCKHANEKNDNFVLESIYFFENT